MCPCPKVPNLKISNLLQPKVPKVPNLPSCCWTGRMSESVESAQSPETALLLFWPEQCADVRKCPKCRICSAVLALSAVAESGRPKLLLVDAILMQLDYS